MFKNNLTKSLVVLILIFVSFIGIFIPSFIARTYMKTERGEFERGQLALVMEDWRFLRPCLPYKSSSLKYVSGPSCASEEDGRVIESICWFGIPGPKLRICYKGMSGLDLGIERPVEIRE
ncbi:MAG: hypothetical protein KIH65_004240 [Candidatus Uhrbacteria bacterium]|nr:hypothetical protein [Candidatus Uhrbacteria bacterium]